MSRVEEKPANRARKTRRRRKLRAVQVEIGQSSAAKQKERALAVRSFLIGLKKEFAGKNDKCIVCGETMRNALDHHHLDGNKKNSNPRNIVILCASCHRIIDKAKSSEEAIQDFKARFKRTQE